MWIPLVDALVVGSINWDTTLFARRLPLDGEEVKVDQISEVPGERRAIRRLLLRDYLVRIE